MFEIDKIMFRPNLGMSREVFGLPGRNKSESLHKTDCCNVLSDFFRRSVAPSSGDFFPATVAAVGLWTRSGIYIFF